MNLTSTAPPTPSPASARIPRNRATAATTSTKIAARIPIGRSRLTLKKEKVDACPFRAGVCSTSMVSPRRRPDWLTWGETGTSTDLPFCEPDSRRTRTCPQVGAWLPAWPSPFRGQVRCTCSTFTEG